MLAAAFLDKVHFTLSAGRNLALGILPFQHSHSWQWPVGERAAVDVMLNLGYYVLALVIVAVSNAGLGYYVDDC